MRAIDFAPLSRSTVGFERLFDLLEAAVESPSADHAPPCDIEKTGEDSYRIVLAVAGFAENDLSVTVESNVLTVIGRRPDDTAAHYLYRGIGAGSFRRQFELADYVEVRSAKLQNGMLTIELERELPEAKKPRRIEIARPSGSQLAGSKRAA